MLCYAMLIWPGMIRYDPGWAGACWGLLGSRLGISSRYLLWGGRRPSTSLDRCIRSSTQGTYYGGVEVARTPKNTPRRTSTPHSKYLHPRCSYGPFAIADLTPHWRRNGYLGTSPRPSGQNYHYTDRPDPAEPAPTDRRDRPTGPTDRPTGPLDNDNPSVRRGGQRPSGTTRPWLTMTNEGQSPHHAREAPTLRLASVAWNKAFRGF